MVVTLKHFHMETSGVMMWFMAIKSQSKSVFIIHLFTFIPPILKIMQKIKTVAAETTNNGII